MAAQWSSQLTPTSKYAPLLAFCSHRSGVCGRPASLLFNVAVVVCLRTCVMCMYAGWVGGRASGAPDARVVLCTLPGLIRQCFRWLPFFFMFCVRLPSALVAIDFLARFFNGHSADGRGASARSFWRRRRWRCATNGCDCGAGRGDASPTVRVLTRGGGGGGGPAGVCAPDRGRTVFGFRCRCRAGAGYDQGLPEPLLLLICPALFCIAAPPHTLTVARFSLNLTHITFLRNRRPLDPPQPINYFFCQRAASAALRESTDSSPSAFSVSITPDTAIVKKVKRACCL
jgi:hypothetical protein